MIVVAFIAGVVVGVLLLIAYSYGIARYLTKEPE